MTNEVIQNILTRCSVRAYDDRPVEREKIDTLLQCAVHAPSAMNRQPIVFSYNPDDDTAAAMIDPNMESGQALNDLGIAKLHFQIGAGSGTWAWGDGGLFIHR